MATAPKKLYKFGNDTVPFDTDEDAIKYAEELGLSEFTPVEKSGTLPPPMLPLKRERFFTPAAVNARLQNVVEDKAQRDRMDKSAALSYDADFARWSSLPDSEKQGSFMNWVNNVYSGRTADEAARYTAAGMGKFKGREKAGPIKSLLRKAQAITGQTDTKATGGIKDWIPDLSNPMAVGYQALHGLHSALGGESKREGDIKQYMEMRTPIQERTLKETAGDVATAFHPANWLETARAMTDPRDVAATAAGFIPVGGEAGIATKLLRIGAKSKGVGGKLASIAAKTAARTVPALAASGVQGGLVNMAADEQGDLGRAFQTGLVPGILMGGLGELGQYGARKLAGWSSYDPNAPAIDPNAAPVEKMPWQKDVEQLRMDRARRAGADVTTEPLAIEDFLGSKLVDDLMAKGSLTREAQQFLKLHANDIAPEMPATLTPEQQHSFIRGKLSDLKKSNAPAPVAAPLSPDAAAKLNQILPTERGIMEHASLLPAREQAKWLRNAYDAYHTLRKNDPNYRVIPELESPSFADVSGKFLENRKAAAIPGEDTGLLESELALERDANDLHHTLLTGSALGTLSDDLLSIDPKQLRLLISDPERFSALRPQVEAALGPDKLALIENASRGGVSDENFAKITKKVLESRKADLAATTGTQQGQMDQAVDQKALRDQVAASESQPSPGPDVEGEARNSRIEKLIQSKHPEAIQTILYDEILKDPMKAELFGIDRDIAIDAADSKSPISSHSQKELKALLVDKASEVKRTGLPKGFM